MQTITFVYTKKRWRIVDIKNSRAKTKKVKYNKKKKELTITSRYIAHNYQQGGMCAKPHRFMDWTIQ